MLTMSHAAGGALLGLMMSTALVAPALADWAPTAQIGVANPNALIWDPVDPKTLYAGGTNAVYVSHDMGATWTAAPIPVVPNVSFQVSSILRDPGSKAIDVSIESAVLRASQPGAVWQSTPIEYATFVPDPKVARGAWLSANGQLFRSQNGGASWSQRPAKFDNGTPFVRAMAVDAEPTQGIYLASNDSVLKSVDEGANFKEVFKATSPTSASVFNVATGALATVFAIVDTENNQGQSTSIVTESTDGGSSWAGRSAGLPATALLETIAVDRLNPAIAYAGGVRTAGVCPFYRTTAASGPWTCSDPSPTLLAADNIATRPAGGVAVGGPGGIWISTNSGKAWKQAAGAGFSQPVFEDFVADPRSGNWFVSTADGLFRSPDHGASWTNIVGGLPLAPPIYGDTISALAGRLALDAAASPAALYVATPGGLVRSRDFGQTFKPVSIIADKVKVSITSVFTDPSSAGRVWALWPSGLGRSDDFGTTWSMVTIPVSPGLVGAIVSDPSRPGRVYLTSDSGAYVSTNGGKNWALTFEGNAIGLTIATKPVPTFYLPTYYFYGDFPYDYIEVPALLKSTDRGATWSSQTTPNGLSIGTLVVQPNGTTIYAEASPALTLGGGSAGTVFQSGDGGATWQPVTTGLPAGGLATILRTTPDTLIAGVQDVGLYTQAYSSITPRK